MDKYTAGLLKAGDYLIIMDGPYFGCPKHLEEQFIGCVVENWVRDYLTGEPMCRIEWEDGSFGDLLHSQMGHVTASVSQDELDARNKASRRYW